MTALKDKKFFYLFRASDRKIILHNVIFQILLFRKIERLSKPKWDRFFFYYCLPKHLP
jgi:hypothetical protein